MTSFPISTVTLQYDHDLLAVRRRTRTIAEALGFDQHQQTRLATVASEIARNALRYAHGGRFEFAIQPDAAADSLVMSVIDQGPGIAHLDQVLQGTYVSSTGMGIGILGARRLVDDFRIDSTAGRGTCVTMRKLLPGKTGRLDAARVRKIADDLASQRPADPIDEMQQQNADLLRALSDLNDRREEMERLNLELEDTNRGVLALYAELDEKAESLRRADQLKTHFLSDMSHEFRTPVNAILALTRMLEEGPLELEGRKQVMLIRRAAEDLESLVSDLLDLAKIEAGKVDIRAADFEVANLFSALRGMLRPLLLHRSISLAFDEVPPLPPMFTDEGKLAQILRNFISNAIKYTEVGEVRVNATPGPSGHTIIFSVADTGIGISAEDQDRIFEEFTQIDNSLQRKHKGTGLGLPLTRKLAALLGGTVGMRSKVGVGSTFFAEIPIRYTPPTQQPGGRIAPAADAEPAQAAGNTRILIIDDDETARYTIGTFASRPGAQVIEAENGLQGIERAQSDHPDVILLDMMMPGIGGHEVLQRLKQDSVTADIPVVIVTSRFINDAEREQILSRAISVVYKGELSREVVTKAVDEALKRGLRTED